MIHEMNVAPQGPVTVAWLDEWSDTHGPTALRTLSRRELSCILGRYRRLRDEFAARVQGAIAKDAQAPVGSNQKILGYYETRLDEIQIELARREMAGPNS